MRSASACSADTGLALALALAAAAAAAEPEALTLSGLMARMAASPGVEARFREIRELELLAAPLESRGELYFVPPDRLARFTTWPGPSALIVDGEALHYREGDEVFDLSSSPAARAFADNLIVLFRGDLASLEELYATAFESQGSEWRLVLTPRRPPLSRVVASLSLRGDGAGMRQVSMLDTDGNRTTTLFEEADPQRRFSPEELERLFATGP